MFHSGGIRRAGNGARRSFASGTTHARRCPPQRSLSPKGAAGTLFAAALAAAAKLLPALRFNVSGTLTFRAAVVPVLWCVVRALMADAWATPLERVEFESASQRLISGGLIRGDRIQGYLAKPDGAGPFPAVVGLHG